MPAPPEPAPPEPASGAPAVQVVARGPRAAAEGAAAAFDADPRLEAIAYALLEEDEARGRWRLDVYPQGSDEARAVRAALGAFPALDVTTETLADADWLALALSGLPPVRAGRFFIYGAHDAGEVPADTVNLRIEAGAAFGTGHHGSTTGCLEAFDRLLGERVGLGRVLDVGCGTGVLAIAAARTGSAVAVGTDLDPVSVRIARENAALNAARAVFHHAEGLDHPGVAEEAPYDLIFANILAPPLIALAPDIAAALRPGGLTVLSGMLHAQAAEVRAAYVAAGLAPAFDVRQDAWTTLALVNDAGR